MQGCGAITAEPCPCGISHSSLLVRAHPHHPFSYQGEVLCISSASSRAFWVPQEKDLQSPVPTSCHPCVGTPSCHQHPGQEQLRGARQERVAAPHISSMNFAAFATPEAPANTSARSRFYFSPDFISALQMKELLPNLGCARGLCSSGGSGHTEMEAAVRPQPRNSSCRWCGEAGAELGLPGHFGAGLSHRAGTAGPL